MIRICGYYMMFFIKIDKKHRVTGLTRGMGGYIRETRSLKSEWTREDM